MTKNNIKTLADLKSLLNDKEKDQFKAEDEKRQQQVVVLRERVNALNYKLKISYHEKKMCTGKNKYKTKEIAQYALDHQRNDKGLNIYECPYCKEFHLGHPKYDI